MMSYHHWDEEEETSGWHWYYVTAYSVRYDEPLKDPWPVCAAGFQEAMDIYEVLWEMSVNQ